MNGVEGCGFQSTATERSFAHGQEEAAACLLGSQADLEAIELQVPLLLTLRPQRLNIMPCLLRDLLHSKAALGMD